MIETTTEQKKVTATLYIKAIPPMSPMPGMPEAPEEDVPEDDVVPGSGIVEIIVNSGQVDRENEQIMLDGLDYKSFMANYPVLCAFHQYDQPPIGKFLSLWRDNAGMLRGLVQFAINISPLADQLYKMAVAGFPLAVSIGFRPMEGAVNPTTGVMQYTKSEMLEASIVAVPADAPSGVVALKSIAGVNAKSIKRLISGKMTVKEFNEEEEDPAVEDLQVAQKETDPTPEPEIIPEPEVPVEETPEPKKEEPAPKDVDASEIIKLIDKAAAGVKGLLEKAQGLEGREKEAVLSKAYELTKLITQSGELANATIRRAKRQVVKQIRYVLRKGK